MTDSKDVEVSRVRLKEELLPVGRGIGNIGNTCFYASMINSLMSVSSIFDVAAAKQIDRSKHVLLNYLCQMRENPSNYEKIAHSVYYELLRLSSNRKGFEIRLGHQHDAQEALVVLLEQLTLDSNIDMLFRHRYRREIKCQNPECGHITRNKEENHIFTVEINPSDYKTSLSSFLLGYKTVVKNFVCAKCEKTSATALPKVSVTSLKMIPEVLFISFNKYHGKKLIEFPLEMFFPSNQAGYKSVYRLIAQVEHLGGQNGGHYYAYCLRSDGWKKLDDSSVTDMEKPPTPTSNTYLVCYHFVGLKAD